MHGAFFMFPLFRIAKRLEGSPNKSNHSQTGNDFKRLHGQIPTNLTVFDLQPQFKYMNYFIYTSHNLTVSRQCV